MKRPRPNPALTTAADIPKPPATLLEQGRKLWHRIQLEYEIRDAGGLAILEQACRCLDRAEQCASLITKDGGATAIRLELTARALACRLISRLGIGVEPVKSPGHPASPYGITPEDLELLRGN